MSKFVKSFFLLCGVSFALAAFPVFGQQSEKEIQINKKPLQDFAESVKDKISRREIDLEKPFSVELESVLTKDGRFDAKNTKFTKTEGDAKLVYVVKQGFEAIGDSGWLAYLSSQGIQQIKLSAMQDSDTFSFSVISALPTIERANTISSGLSFVVSAALMMDRNGIKKLGDDEKKLLNNTRINAKGKIVNINISLPAADFREMLERRMNESKENKEVTGK